MAFDNTNTAATVAPTSGVRWSGMNDERSWAVSPELQAELDAAFVKAVARQEAELAAMIAARKGA